MENPLRYLEDRWTWMILFLDFLLLDIDIQFNNEVKAHKDDKVFFSNNYRDLRYKLITFLTAPIFYLLFCLYICIIFYSF